MAEWARLDDIIAALDKEAESEDAKTRVKAKNLSNVSNPAIEWNIADALEENLNLQIEAAVTFSAQHGVNAETEFAKHHRKRVAPRRIDDTPENAVHFGLQTFYRKEFLQVLDAQILLLEGNLKVAFKIIEPAVSGLLKPPYTKVKLFQRCVVAD